MTDRKFYQTEIKVVVLSEEPIPDTMSLEEIAREAMDGDYSFRWVRKPPEVLNGKQAAKALVQQDSDPGFFRLTDDGEDEDWVGN